MSSKDQSISDKLFQALLDHLWNARDRGLPKTIDQAPRGYTISYKELVELAKVPIDPRNAGGHLFHVAEKCVSLKWPAIHSLAVNKETGMPGPGFFSAPPRSQSYPATPGDWEQDVLACISFPHFERNIRN